MYSKRNILIICFIAFSTNFLAQNDSLLIENPEILKEEKGGIYRPLAPSKAAFYSAVFPGMGQIYNKKYWKAPIVWGALAIPTYFYLTNNREFKRYRNAYRLRLSGFRDEFTLDDGTETVSKASLEAAQEQLRENRDLSLLVAVILYVLQIVEASVNAHLLQFNIDNQLSFRPNLINNSFNINRATAGLTIKYNF